MLYKQVIKDQRGVTTGVFIPIQIWENLIFHYPEIETFNIDIPEWEKDLINARLDMVQNHPERLRPIEMLFENL